MTQESETIERSKVTDMLNDIIQTFAPDEEVQNNMRELAERHGFTGLITNLEGYLREKERQAQKV